MSSAPPTAGGEAYTSPDGPTLAAGTLVGSYLIESRATRSGFAEIYLGRHVARTQAAAIKVLHAHHAQTPSLLRRFRREAALLERLRHPNIVEFWESGALYDGRPYIAMEWLEGHTLKHELATRGAMTVAEAEAIMTDIVVALATAHRHGVVHRDLKAQNIMVIPGGVVPGGKKPVIKLIDFGIARLQEPMAGAGDHVTKNTILGTPDVMAPEQIRGQPADARTDVYAAGVILYQLVTGRLPFVGQSIQEVQTMHLEAPPPRASDIASVPTGIDRVIERCMAKSPDDRYPTIDGFRSALAAGGRLDSTSEPSGPGAAFASDEPLMIAMYVEARVDVPALDTMPVSSELADDGDLPDDVLDDVDEVVTTAKQAIAGVCMTIALETSNAVLAVYRPGGDVAPHVVRKRIIGRALDLARALDARETRHATVHARVTVHAARADELLRPGAWSSLHPGGGVMATSAAIAGRMAVELGVDLTPVTGSDSQAFLLAQAVTLE